MKYVLMPFITIYHIVSAITSAPGKLFQKAEEKALDTKEKKKKQKEQKTVDALNSTNQALAENTMQQPATPSETVVNAEVQNSSMQTNGAPMQSDVPEEKKLSDMPTQDETNAKTARAMKSFRYTILNSFGKKEVGTFDAETEDDVRGFLLSQEYEILEVKERSKYDIDINIGNKISAQDLSFSLTQLSTYIKSGIPLVDGVKILAKQTKKVNLKKSFNQLVYELLRGETLSNAMLAQGEVYPKLLVNMVKIN